jgi:hypothetical protein
VGQGQDGQLLDPHRVEDYERDTKESHGQSEQKGTIENSISTKIRSIHKV